MTPLRFLRYLAPNIITAAALLMGLASLLATHHHHYVTAAWLIVWAVLLDRVDGMVARLLRSTSEFGAQMDSFADMVNFGIAPAFLIAVALGSSAELGFAQGGGKWQLWIGCATWALANVFRLARFNVAKGGPEGVFFGIPTTLAAGTLAVWFLVLVKYAPAESMLSVPEAFRDARLYGAWAVPETAWRWLPTAMLAGALLMVCNLPFPKLARLGRRWLDPLLLVGVVTGYALGFARLYPEVLAWIPTIWLVFFGVRAFRPAARRGHPPAFLPEALAGRGNNLTLHDEYTELDEYAELNELNELRDLDPLGDLELEEDLLGRPSR